MTVAVSDEFNNTWRRRRLGLGDLSLPERRAIRRTLRVLAEAAALAQDARAEKLRRSIRLRGGWVYVGASCLKVEFDLDHGQLHLQEVARCVPKARC